LTTTGDLYACKSQTNFDTIINRQHTFVGVCEGFLGIPVNWDL
jgi:hypothetical protein